MSRRCSAIEHEASDRLKGLDSRPFDFLLGEARKTAAIIADPAALKDEEDRERCRNATRPIRKICAGAAQALVEILDKHVASAQARLRQAAICRRDGGDASKRSGLQGTLKSGHSRTQTDAHLHITLAHDEHRLFLDVRARCAGAPGVTGSTSAAARARSRSRSATACPSCSRACSPGAMSRPTASRNSSIRRCGG